MIKLFKTVWYIITGRLNKLAEVWGTNPYAISAEYDSVAKKQQETGSQLADAVAQIMVQQESKKVAYEQVVTKLEKQQRLVTGALSKLQNYVEAQKKLGKTQEEITASQTYRDLSKYYSDFKSTLKEQETHKSELEKDLERLNGEVSKYEGKLKEVNREIKKIKDEKGSAIAAILSAEAEKKINNALANIGNDDSSSKLAELRGRVAKAKAEASLSSRLSGADVATQEAEFLAEAERSEQDSELTSMLFGSPTSDVEKDVAEKVTVPAE